jgi:hypothetical protein
MLKRRTEHEFAGMKYKRLVNLRFHQRGQLVLLQRRVDVGVAGVDEDPEEAVQSHVDAGGLKQLLIERIDAQSPGVDLNPHVTVRQQHGATLVGRRLVPGRLIAEQENIQQSWAPPAHRGDVRSRLGCAKADDPGPKVTTVWCPHNHTLSSEVTDSDIRGRLVRAACMIHSPSLRV